MKITDVRACQPIASGSPNDWRTTIGQILVAIDTDAGLTGYGVGGGGAAGIHVIEAELRPALLGRDPSPVEEIWDALYDLTLPYGQAGIAIMAQSGVDLALWDLRGKDAGRPVAAIRCCLPLLLLKIGMHIVVVGISLCPEHRHRLLLALAKLVRRPQKHLDQRLLNLLLRGKLAAVPAAGVDLSQCVRGLQRTSSAFSACCHKHLANALPPRAKLPKKREGLSARLLVV